MPLLPLGSVFDRLRCPRCRAVLSERRGCSNVACDLSRSAFTRIADQLVLIDPDDSIVDVASIRAASEGARGPLRRVLGRLAVENAVAPRIAARLSRDVASGDAGARPVVVVIGGGTVGSGLERLYADERLDLVAFDVYPSRFTQFVADAHRVPLDDRSVDAVVVQAVLEHVLDPGRVAAEIHRILRPDGVVYADTPFLQHVHEGPFDFTRFTESGHRWLFRWFTLVESGQVAGVGTELAWSVAQALRSVVPIRGVSSAVRLAMTPLALLIDRLANPRESLDGASSVYFYGRRAETAIAPRDIVAHYSGAQRRPIRSA